MELWRGSSVRVTVTVVVRSSDDGAREGGCPGEGGGIGVRVDERDSELACEFVCESEMGERSIGGSALFELNEVGDVSAGG